MNGCHQSQRFWIGVAAITLLLGACGGSGGSDEENAANVVTRRGIFFDAPVQGLCYRSTPSGLAGVTDAAGAYAFAEGDTVSFAVPTEGVCNGRQIELGAVSSAPVSGGVDALTFVLNLPAGARVAQLLHALNHGSTSVMHVGELRIPATNADAVAAWLASDDVDHSSDNLVPLLRDLQNGAVLPGGTAWVTPVDTQFAATVSRNLAEAVQSLPAATVDLSDLPGKPVWIADVSESGDQHNYIGQFGQDNQLRLVQIGEAAPSAEDYSINGNRLSVGNLLATVHHRQSGQMLYTATASYQDDNGDPVSENSVGSLNLLTPLNTAALAGKTLTLASALWCGADATYVVAADGSELRLRPEGSAPPIAISTDPALPGLLKLVNPRDASTFFIGLDGDKLGVGATLHYTLTAAGGSTWAAHGHWRVIANPGTPATCPPVVPKPVAAPRFTTATDGSARIELEFDTDMRTDTSSTINGGCSGMQFHWRDDRRTFVVECSGYRRYHTFTFVAGGFCALSNQCLQQNVVFTFPNDPNLPVPHLVGEPHFVTGAEARISLTFDQPMSGGSSRGNYDPKQSSWSADRLIYTMEFNSYTSGGEIVFSRDSFCTLNGDTLGNCLEQDVVFRFP